MKGFLKAGPGYIALGPKSTLIGREGCDIVIPSVDVDTQHAIIEYSTDSGFVIQDLNSSTGTYVNDCRVQNASVRLAAGDIIRFGPAGHSYQLVVEVPSQFQYPPPTTPKEQRFLTVVDDGSSQLVDSSRKPLPLLNAIGPLSPQQAWSSSSGAATLPRPPRDARRRPMSADSRTRPPDTRSSAITTSPLAASSSQSDFAKQALSGSQSWVDCITGTVSAANMTATSLTRNANSMEALIQEKESKIQRLTDEINRLTIFESESLRKDQVIMQLRDEIRNVQERFKAMQQNPNQEVTNRLRELENEVSSRSMEVSSLKDQLNAVRITSNAADLRDQLNDKIHELAQVRSELERTKKDKNITAGLVTQLQRDMANKDTTISQLAREIESLKRSLKERDNEITAHRKARSKDEENVARDRELTTLRNRFKVTESKLQEQQSLIEELQEQIATMRKGITEEREKSTSLTSSLEKSRAQNQELEMSERSVRVELEQNRKKLERLRTRLMQAAFSVGNGNAINCPDGEVTEDFLCDSLKQFLEERNQLRVRCRELDDTLKDERAMYKDTWTSLTAIRDALGQAKIRLDRDGVNTKALAQEVELLSSCQIEKQWDWLKESILSLWQMCRQALDDIEASLIDHGCNFRVLGKTPGTCIGELFDTIENLGADKRSLEERIVANEIKFKEKLDIEVKQITEQLKTDFDLRLELAKTSAEDEHQAALERLRLDETEKRDTALEAERKKVLQLQATIERLQSSIVEQKQQHTVELESLKGPLDELETLRSRENELTGQLTELQREKGELVAEHESRIIEMRMEYSREIDLHKAAAHQHSLTICNMEEKLNRAVNDKIHLQKQADQLRQQLDKANSAKAARRVASPSKTSRSTATSSTPSVVSEVDMTAQAHANQTIFALRRENADLTRRLREIEAVNDSLRHELHINAARLSDLGGEMSEQQKELLESARVSVAEKERELLTFQLLVDTRAKLAKLSKICERQTAEIKELTDELSKHKASTAKYKNAAAEKESTVKEVEARLLQQVNEQQKQIEALQQDGQVSTELSAIGAQCRGERHERVIGRQREALAELRNRIKDLERIKPPLPTHDKALQQIIVLKRELAALRASQVLQHEADQSDIQSLENEINQSRGGHHVTLAELNREKGSHRETREILEASEDSYLTLLRALASCLEMDSIAGHRNMAELPRDQREKLLLERERSCQQLSSRIKLLKERVQRKEEMLGDYERNLIKLRQMEEIVKKKQAQLDGLADDVRSRSEEVQYLREALQGTRDRYDQEQRLNKAIKQKKTFHLENEFKADPQHRHNCAAGDRWGAQSATPKSRSRQSQSSKRKNYEIRVLKDQLTDRNRELANQSQRVIALEQSIRSATPRHTSTS